MLLNDASIRLVCDTACKSVIIKDCADKAIHRENKKLSFFLLTINQASIKEL